MHLRKDRLFITLAALCLLMALPVFAAEVTNVTAQQMGSRVQFTYDLVGQEREADVDFRVTVDGRTRGAADLHLEGDYRKVSTGSGKVAYWNVLQDYPKGYNGRISWEITSAINFNGTWEISWQENNKTEKRVVNVTQSGTRVWGKNSLGSPFEGRAGDNEMAFVYKFDSLKEIEEEFPAMPVAPRKDLLGRLINEYELRRVPGSDTLEGTRYTVCVEWSNERIVKSSTREFWGNCRDNRQKVTARRLK